MLELYSCYDRAKGLHVCDDAVMSVELMNRQPKSEPYLFNDG